MNPVNNYFKAKSELLDYFGYPIPTWFGVSDCRHWYWGLRKTPAGEQVLITADNPKAVGSSETDYDTCDNTIESTYKPCGVDQAVFRTDLYTLVCCLDDNDIYLRLLSNEKEIM